MDQEEEKILEINDIKQEDKMRGKRVKINEQILQEIWNYEKRPNLHLIGYLNVMGRMNPSWKTLFRILSRRTSPTWQGRPTFKSRKYREHQVFLKKNNPGHIIIRFTMVEMN